MTPEYAAGIVDGEGSIYVTRSSYKNYRRHSLQVVVAGCFQPLMAALKTSYGGTVRGRDTTKNLLSKKPQFEWRICGPKAAHFLSTIYPFMLEKKEQAWLAMEFEAQKDTPVNQEELALRDGFYWALRGAK